MSHAAAREPILRQKSNGAWFVRWAGKDHYLGKDKATAEWAWLSPESPHAGSRAKWQAWRAESAYGREGRDTAAGHGAGTTAHRTNRRLRHLTLAEASVLFSVTARATCRWPPRRTTASTCSGSLSCTAR